VTDEAMKPEVPDPKPPSDGERKKLVLSLRMRDVTHQQSGKVFAMIGASPPRRKLYVAPGIYQSFRHAIIGLCD
jgi:hypothetical protein